MKDRIKKFQEKRDQQNIIFENALKNEKANHVKLAIRFNVL